MLLPDVDILVIVYVCIDSEAAPERECSSAFEAPESVAATADVVDGLPEVVEPAVGREVTAVCSASSLSNTSETVVVVAEVAGESELLRTFEADAVVLVVISVKPS